MSGNTGQARKYAYLTKEEPSVIVYLIREGKI
jgi:hypothetical protein